MEALSAALAYAGAYHRDSLAWQKAGSRLHAYLQGKKVREGRGGG